MKLNAMQHVCCRQLLAKWPPCTPERSVLVAKVMSTLLAKTVCAEDISKFELQTRWEEGAYDARTYGTYTYEPSDTEGTTLCYRSACERRCNCHEWVFHPHVAPASHHAAVGRTCAQLQPQRPQPRRP